MYFRSVRLLVGAGKPHEPRAPLGHGADGGAPLEGEGALGRSLTNPGYPWSRRGRGALLEGEGAPGRSLPNPGGPWHGKALAEDQVQASLTYPGGGVLDHGEGVGRTWRAKMARLPFLARSSSRHHQLSEYSVNRIYKARYEYDHNYTSEISLDIYLGTVGGGRTPVDREEAIHAS